MQIRRYNKKEVITFRSTREVYGGLSNMAAGYTIFVNGIKISSSEALYQACKFPYNPEVQHEIINQKSPMTAKMISRKNNRLVRKDWEEIRVKIMRWCLEVKLTQNWELFSNVILLTGNKNIVEFSAKDKIWGATDIGNGYLEGVNALGRLLMELREKFIKDENVYYCVEPLSINDFLLYENKIDWVCEETNDIFDLQKMEGGRKHQHLVCCE